ncbi:MAG: hypothetical protein Q7S40_31745 [Opitutaceae bacterium]|nr:hypothetical protein [Opitutaceae bacterium]
MLALGGLGAPATVHPKPGTPVTRSERDDLTFAMVREAFAAFAREVRQHDPHLLIDTGDAILRPSAWHQEHEGRWTHDTPEQYAQMLTLANPDPVSAISLHVDEDDKQRIAKSLEIARLLNKPLFIGKFGAGGTEAAQAVKFRCLLTAIEDSGVPLAALGVFDLSSQKDWTVTATNARSWQFQEIAEANARLRQPKAESARQKTSTPKQPLKYPIVFITHLISAAGIHAAAKPNILLILADGQGYDDLSRTGNPQLRKPKVDRLAAQGVRSERFT